MNSKQYTFSEMSRKMVVNIADGRELGHVCDMVFNNCGGIIGLVVPGKKSLFKSITSSDNIFIAWNRIVKIGSDVILAEVVGMSANTMSNTAQTQSKQACNDMPMYHQQAYQQSAPQPTVSQQSAPPVQVQSMQPMPSAQPQQQPIPASQQMQPQPVQQVTAPQATMPQSVMPTSQPSPAMQAQNIQPAAVSVPQVYQDSSELSAYPNEPQSTVQTYYHPSSN